MSERLARLRAALAHQGLAGFVVPHADEHQSEYLPPSAERLAWLTGFTGSAGTAVVLADEAAIFIDGRYTLQAANEVGDGAYAHQHLVENPPARWLGAHVKTGARVGYDPWLMTLGEVRRFEEACAAAGAAFVPVHENPIDALWTDRPPPPLGAVSLHPLAYAGEEAADKIARLQADIAAKRADAAVLTQADSIAWTFNIRGRDIAHNPVALAFAIVPVSGKPELYLDPRKLTNSVRESLATIAELRDPRDFRRDLEGLGARHGRILIDPKTAASAVATLITDGGGHVVEGNDPVVLPRARKNATEIAGARAAHVRDGAAMVRFLAWLDREAPKGGLDEIAAAERLAEFRAETARADGSELVDLSFDTISGAGPNGAIIHYRVSPKTARKLEPDTLYLVDSGAQYRDGTTDITRTVALGQPTAEMRDRFTRVLKGNIALGTARLPVGGTDAQLDSLARTALWQAGLDYDHGTGHGIGSFLAVHEGPTRVARRGNSVLEPGMIFSNEPGYYKPGAWGIRTENLLLVLPAREIAGGDRPMLSFETLTLCPIDRRLIEPALMRADEIAWLDGYHATLTAKLGHLLDGPEKAWLAEVTRPLAD